MWLLWQLCGEEFVLVLTTLRAWVPLFDCAHSSPWSCPVRASFAFCALPTGAHTLCRVLRPSFGVSLVSPFSLVSRASVVAGVGRRDELFGLTRAWMASSSVGRGAARAPPPPDRLAVFYKLVDKKVIAAVLCRYARAVELGAVAAT